MAALFMACVWRGMNEDEIVALTSAMVSSGETIAFALDRPVVDKHSSGGVSDLVSLVVVPIVAACGVAVAKLSGRALGHTGGTIDKLESIPGFRVDLSIAEFREQVARIGCAIAAQSAEIVPADKRLYALRDKTATVPAIGLIVASIVSKKIAGGADAFVFDVKAGRGSFMPKAEDAAQLARTLIRVAGVFGKRAAAIVSNMDEPLGTTIGTGLEVREARRFLRGEERDARSAELCMAVASQMLLTAGVEGAREKVQAALRSGAAYEKFAELVCAQGGTREGLDGLEPRESPQVIVARGDGYIRELNVVALGNLGRLLSTTDPLGGIRIGKRVGDAVKSGEPLAWAYGGSDVQITEIERAFALTMQPVRPTPLIYEVLDAPAIR